MQTPETHQPDSAPRILLVEDDTIIALAEKVQLESAGYRVMLAKSGQEAIETVYREQVLAVVLMDIDLGMDAMDGTEAARVILGVRELPIVFLTGHSEREMVERVRGITRYGYVLKNSGEFVLNQAIEMALELFHSRTATEAQRDLLQTTFRSIQDGILVVRPDLSVEALNPVMEQLWDGPLPAEGRRCYEIMHRSAIACADCPVQRALSDSGVHRKTMSRTGPDGKKRWLEITGFPILNPDRPEPSGVIEVVRDITELRDAQLAVDLSEQELVKVAQRLDAAIEGSRAGLWDWNVQTGEVWFNERWAEIIGYQLADLQPLSIDTWQAACVQEDLEASDRLLRDHFAGITPYYHAELRMRHRDGHVIWVADRGRVISRDQNGNPLRMVGTHTEITEQKQTEARLTRAVAERDALLREMNHRVKNNLHTVRSMISLKRRQLGDGADLSDLDGQIAAVATVHEQLSRAEQAGTEVPLHEYLENLAHYVLTASDSGQKYRLSTALEPIVVDHGDATTVGLIVGEALTNAAKHGIGPAGGGEVLLSLSLLDEKLEIRVQNTTAPPRSRPSEGPGGIGLGLMAMLADGLSGTVTVSEDSPYTVVLTLPRSKSRD